MARDNPGALCRLLLPFIILLLAACQSWPGKMHVAVEPLPVPKKALFKPVNAVPQPQQIFTLLPHQQKAFLDYFNSPDTQHIEPHKRLYRYLESKISGFDYRGDTLKAEQVFDTNSGNCMSLAILTTALAALADIELEYQQVDSAPVYRLENDLLMVSRHVRTFLYDPGFNPEKGMVYFGKPGIVVDYFPQRGDRYGRKISQADFIAMYYQNLAGDAMAEGNLDMAYALIQKGLRQAPLNAQSLNTLAVIYRRAGEQQLAGQTYRYAIAHGTESLDLLDNYRQLLISQNRMQEAESVAQKLGDVDEYNPYKWLKLAEQAFAQQKYSRALGFYRKARDIAPYMEQPYFGLARSHHHLGNRVPAIRALEKAAQASYRDEKRDLYYAKLNSLKAEH
jgi:Tfp pilus assembly protein PilF